MKNMAKKSSFLKTFSLGLVLSCMSINVFECAASSSSASPTEEDESSSSFSGYRPSYLDIPGIDDEELVENVPLLLLEPTLEGDRNELKDRANKDYVTVGQCIKKYMATETAAWVAVKALQTYLKDLSGAHYNLLIFYRLNAQTIIKLQKENLQAQARIAKLESERATSSAAPVPIVSVEFDQLQLALQHAQLRINALEEENEALRRPDAAIELPIILTTKPFWKRFLEWCGWIKVQDGPNERSKLI